MPEQAEEEDEESDDHVVHTKVGSVGSNSLESFSGVTRNGERP